MIDIKVTPAKTIEPASETLVLIHGWGCDGRSWEPILDQLSEHYPIMTVSLPGFSNSNSEPMGSDDFLNACADQLPERFFLLGWSLGGMLATSLAARFPQRVLGLMTLATNLQFVETDDWPLAMSREDFSAFVEGFGVSPEVTLKRFSGLMSKGDESERQLLKALRQNCAESWQQSLQSADEKIVQILWAETLQWLAQLNNRNDFPQLAVPGLHLLADNDALVPSSVAASLAELNSSQTVKTISNASHALHWSQPQGIVTEVAKFIEKISEQSQHSVDKRKVADSFGRAASRYDSVAGLQRQIGCRLLAGIPSDTTPVTEAWLDLGCGTGYFTPRLAQHLGTPEQQVMGLDLSQGMIDFARQERGGDFLWCCGDAENLPVADSSLAGVFSSLAIQWCSNLTALFNELARVVASDGSIHIATLGPRTLTELRQAWNQVDSYTHVNHFASEGDVRAAIDNSELKLLDWQSEDIVLQYQQVRELTYELKTLGAHNMNQGQSSGLTGRQRILKFKQAYESFRQADGHLPATYEVFYLRLGRR